MDQVEILPISTVGRDFVPAAYLPEGQDEYYLRNQQTSRPPAHWRPLRQDEIKRLEGLNNTADNWHDVHVADPFDPGLIKNSEFFGLVRIGCIRPVALQHHDLQVPAGITNSVIVACDIGDDVALHNVHYLAHYIIGNCCILTNIDEMHTTNHAKFGNGIVKQGEAEGVRVWLDLMNESGSRRVVPFDGMIPADAYIWAKYRDDAALQAQLLRITQAQFDARRGFYGTVGDQCVIKNARIIKDVKLGSHAYVKGANKLKNLTIHSAPDERTQIGEGVELVNGIVGAGCHIFYGCKAVRFVLSSHSSLKYGARLINSFLGANSTISCCEVLNNLIFPAHEQHHNNSFLIAGLIMGQSNMAAGATIGSNHNSRSNDNEIQAGRGFWPGLCTSVKHSSRFASFALLAQASYTAELDIPLPFALVNNNPAQDRLEVLPAYWWLYNMYALTRNTWKFHTRDKRKFKQQNIEFEALAPDTVEEILQARGLLETWVAQAELRDQVEAPPPASDELRRRGQQLLTQEASRVAGWQVLGEQMERSRREVLILKPVAAYQAYGQMLRDYAVKTLLSYMTEHPEATFSSMAQALEGAHERRWTNVGGQLMREGDVDQLRRDIRAGILDSWDQIHARYNELWQVYGRAKQMHAWAVIKKLHGSASLSVDQWQAALDTAVHIQEHIEGQVYATREKDFENPYCKVTYRNQAEMDAALGRAEDDGFVKLVREQSATFRQTVAEVRART